MYPHKEDFMSTMTEYINYSENAEFNLTEEAVLYVSDTKHTVMKRSACCDILYQNIHFLFILCSLSRQLSGNVSDQGRYASSNSGWFR